MGMAGDTKIEAAAKFLCPLWGKDKAVVVL